jgi:hypothetical protein
MGASTTSTSTLTVLPPSITGNVGIIPCSLKTFPLKAFSIDYDGTISRDPRPFQHDRDMTHVEAPSSTTVLQMLMPL